MLYTQYTIQIDIQLIRSVVHIVSIPGLFYLKFGNSPGLLILGKGSMITAKIEKMKHDV